MKIEFVDKIINDNIVPIWGKKQYLNFKSNENGYLCYKGKEYTLYLPYIIKNKYIFRIIEFQSDILFTGNFNNDNNIKINFLNESIEFLKRNIHFDFICQNPAYAIFSEIPNNCKCIKFGSYVVDLTKSKEILWKNVHSKHRNVIRKAEEKGIKIVCGFEYIDIAYDMIKETQERSGRTFYNKKYFIDMLNAIKENVYIYICMDNNVQGVAIIVFDEQAGYYLFGGSKDKPLSGAINLMHWKILLDLKNNGISKYDFVGARLSKNIDKKLEGIQRFKARFGGNLAVGYLWKYINVSYKYHLYKLLVFLRTFKYSIDAIDEEIKKG